MARYLAHLGLLTLACTAGWHACTARAIDEILADQDLETSRAVAAFESASSADKAGLMRRLALLSIMASQLTHKPASAFSVNVLGSGKHMKVSDALHAQKIPSIYEEWSGVKIDRKTSGKGKESKGKAQFVAPGKAPFVAPWGLEDLADDITKNPFLALENESPAPDSMQKAYKAAKEATKEEIEKSVASALSRDKASFRATVEIELERGWARHNAAETAIHNEIESSVKENARNLKSWKAMFREKVETELQIGWDRHNAAMPEIIKSSVAENARNLESWKAALREKVETELEKAWARHCQATGGLEACYKKVEKTVAKEIQSSVKENARNLESWKEDNRKTVEEEVKKGWVRHDEAMPDDITSSVAENARLTNLFKNRVVTKFLGFFKKDVRTTVEANVAAESIDEQIEVTRAKLQAKLGKKDTKKKSKKKQQEFQENMQRLIDQFEMN